MVSKIDFVAKAGLIMSKDRPDLWETPADAIRDLEHWMSLVELNHGTAGSGGYLITRSKSILDEDEEFGFDWEWELTRQILSYDSSLDDDDTLFDWTTKSAVFNN